MEYGVFADYYDEFMGNAEYEKRAQYVKSLFLKYDKSPTLLLDLGCGTGTFTQLFKNESTDVIGVDPSIEMLNIARQKMPEALFLNQYAEELDLFGTVDGAVSLMDSLNHITDSDAFFKAIANVSLFLEKDRLFIFDVNTEYKHRTVLANNDFIYDDGDVLCAWQNRTEGLVTEIYLDFFAKSDDGRYERESEYFCERAYKSSEIEKAIQLAGLKTVAVLDDLSFSAPTETSERIFYVTRKV